MRHGTRAAAHIRGSEAYPGVNGYVLMEQTPRGVLVTAEIGGLPREGGEIFALHIHEGGGCGGTSDDPFAAAGGHYNPEGKPHPYHAGDLPPLFGNDGYAYMSVLTDRFSVVEVVGRPLIVHRDRDDFTTQPSGDAGERMACGVITLGWTEKLHLTTTPGYAIIIDNSTWR